jgi:YVTN family beta-propeller protein
MDPNPTVSVINTSTNTVTATIFVRDYPEVVAVTPDGTKVYMTNIDLTMFL